MSSPRRPPPPRGGRSPPRSPPSAPGAIPQPPPVPMDDPGVPPPPPGVVQVGPPPNGGNPPPLMNEAHSPIQKISPESPHNGNMNHNYNNSNSNNLPELQSTSSQAYMLGNQSKLPNGLQMPPSKEITFYREQGHTLAWDFCVNIINPLDDFVYYFPKEEESRFELSQTKSSNNGKSKNRFKYEGNILTTDTEDSTIEIFKCHLHSHVLKNATVEQFYKDCVDIYQQVNKHFGGPAKRAATLMKFCIGWTIFFGIAAGIS